MAVQASAEVVRDMKKTLDNSVKKLEKIGQDIGNSSRAAQGWNDSQGQQYQALMKKIASLTQQPISTLRQASPKLEKLAQALDNYGRVKF